MYILQNLTLAVLLAWSAFASAQGAIEKREVHIAVGGKASESMTNDFANGNVTLDGVAPLSGNFDNVQLLGATGPTDSAAPITMVVDGALHWATPSGSTHTMFARATKPAGNEPAPRWNE